MAIGKKQEKPKAKRLNVSTPTERVDHKTGEVTGTFWTNCGSAFESEKGLHVILDVLPINGKLFISEPKEKVSY